MFTGKSTLIALSLITLPAVPLLFSDMYCTISTMNTPIHPDYNNETESSLCMITIIDRRKVRLTLAIYRCRLTEWAFYFR